MNPDAVRRQAVAAWHLLHTAATTRGMARTHVPDHGEGRVVPGQVSVFIRRSTSMTGGNFLNQEDVNDIRSYLRRSGNVVVLGVVPGFEDESPVKRMFRIFVREVWQDPEPPSAPPYAPTHVEPDDTDVPVFPVVVRHVQPEPAVSATEPSLSAPSKPTAPKEVKYMSNKYVGNGTSPQYLIDHDQMPHWVEGSIKVALLRWLVDHGEVRCADGLMNAYLFAKAGLDKYMPTAQDQSTITAFLCDAGLAERSSHDPVRGRDVPKRTFSIKATDLGHLFIEHVDRMLAEGKTIEDRDHPEPRVGHRHPSVEPETEAVKPEPKAAPTVDKWQDGLIKHVQEIIDEHVDDVLTELIDEDDDVKPEIRRILNSDHSPLRMLTLIETLVKED